MLDPFGNMRKYLVWTFILIVFLLMSGIAVGSEKILRTEIQPIEPSENNGQYCFIKVVIKQKDDQIMKEEILECADGKRKPDGLGYWELFAQFYYHDVNTPEYCRKYSRSGHAFKSYGTVCLNTKGEWEVK
tara:strand:+ start:62 stop:454 length:393 start_codon:yes stop_codon:yes gene_type:complete